MKSDKKQKNAGIISEILRFVVEKGGEAALIPTKDVVTAEWVRQKCLFGCNGFGRRFSCPPYTPAPAETRKVLREYKSAVLIRFLGDVGQTKPDRLVSREMTAYVQNVMYDLEKMAFSAGFYKAFGYTGHQCGLCAHCKAKDDDAKITDCVNRRKMRPSMEAAGIDVYATCASVGWDLEVLSCAEVEGGSVLDSPMTTVMLLLIE